MDQIIRNFMHIGVVTCRVDANAAEVVKITLDNDFFGPYRYRRTSESVWNYLKNGFDQVIW
jgi:hypothetical protein